MGTVTVLTALKKSFWGSVYCHSKPLDLNCFPEENHRTNLAACCSGLKTLNKLYFLCILSS